MLFLSAYTLVLSTICFSAERTDQTRVYTCVSTYERTSTNTYEYVRTNVLDRASNVTKRTHLRTYVDVNKIVRLPRSYVAQGTARTVYCPTICSILSSKRERRQESRERFLLSLYDRVKGAEQIYLN